MAERAIASARGRAMVTACTRESVVAASVTFSVRLSASYLTCARAVSTTFVRFFSISLAMR